MLLLRFFIKVYYFDVLTFFCQFLHQVIHRLICFFLIFMWGAITILKHLYTNAFLESFPQLSYLVLILLKQRIFRVLIDYRLILDLFGTRCISQRRKRLVVVVVCGRDRCDHDCLRVATE